MISANLLNSAVASAVFTHLLQSTAFLILAWLLTLALRNYPARVRFCVWMSASIKFLVPFALLTSLGTRLAIPRPQTLHSVLYTVVQQFDGPFAQADQVPAPVTLAHSVNLRSWMTLAVALVWAAGCLVMLARWAKGWLIARRLIRDSAPVNGGPELLALQRAETYTRIRGSIRIVRASCGVEPGIFGVFSPVLLWPSGLSEQLDEAQIRAIVAHEIEHVRRRDNLTSALHALVEVLFWFHPAVYWMRSKLNEERERACDESVLQQSARPQDYAEGILKVCAFCLESPLPCVAGVSGSDLKERVLRIMKHRPGVTLTIGRRILLLAAGVLAVALPLGFGVVRGQTAAASGTDARRDLPKYEVASIKPSTSDDGRSLFRITPDGASMQGVEVRMLLRNAFRLEPDRIIGAPSWASSNRFDIEAKVAPEDAPKLDKLKAEDRGAMLLPLLVERFNLKYHHETRELPMYTLVVAKGGPKLTPAKDEPAPSHDDAPNVARAPQGPANMRGRIMMSPGRIETQAGTMDMLAHVLSPQLGHTVVDKTGLTGNYDYMLQWTPDEAAMPMGGGPGGGPGGGAGHDSIAVEAGGPSLFTAIEEQLGLKLESTKGSVDVIVIDHIDLPSAN